ncbi:MAG: hypothetical protein GY937_28360 [bacterium]|nr:hypothetical protein [bacterium]
MQPAFGPFSLASLQRALRPTSLLARRDGDPERHPMQRLLRGLSPRIS